MLKEAISHLQASGWQARSLHPQLSPPSHPPSPWGRCGGGVPPTRTLLPSSLHPFFLMASGALRGCQCHRTPLSQGRPKRGLEWGPGVVPEEVGIRGAQRETRIESHQTSGPLPSMPLPGALSPQTVFWRPQSSLNGVFSLNLTLSVSPKPCIDWLGPLVLPGTPHSSLMMLYFPQDTYHLQHTI